MSRYIRMLFVAVLGLAACASTTVLSTWKDPTIDRVHFSKVLVVAPGRDPALRRSSEDELVRHIENAQAVASYAIMPEADLASDEAIRARARAAGFDGAVVMRLVSVRKEASWVPGTWSGPIYAYGGWPAYDPGYVQVDTYARVETNIYSVPDDRLMWAAASQTVNPKSLRSLVSSTAKAVAKEMKHEGLLR